MDSSSLRRLIEQTIAEVLGEMDRTSGVAPEPHPVVLLTGEVVGLPVALHQIKRLSEECGPVTAVLSESFRDLIDIPSFQADTGLSEVVVSLSRREADALCARASLLLVATLSANSCAKMALGIEDSIPSVLWAAARAARIPLWIAQPPERLMTESSPSETPARLRQREEMLGTLRGDGAHIIPAAEVFERLLRFLLETGDPIAAKRAREAGPRAIITVEDVERAHRRGLRTWALPGDAIVTAAAWDRARDLGLDLSGGNLP